MKKKLFAAAAFTLLISPALFADAGNGEKLFKKKGCVACHHPTKDQRKSGLGPSIEMIKQAYAGDKAALVNFLQGKGEPKVDKDRFPIMKGQLNQIKNLPVSDLESIADFYLK